MKYYYLENYLDNKYLLNKKEIFDLFDRLIIINRYKITRYNVSYMLSYILKDDLSFKYGEGSYKTDKFRIITKRYNADPDSGYYESIEYWSCNAYCVIKNFNGYKVDIEKFKKEYIQSRFHNKKEKNRRYKKDRFYRARIKKQYADGWKREYSDFLKSKECDYKIRKKRLNDIKSKFIYYSDDVKIRYSQKSWKQKKIKKQYMKNLK